MPYTKQNLAAGDVLTEANVDAFDDGIYEAYLAMENRQPTGAAFPFRASGTRPAVGRLVTYAGYESYGSGPTVSDGYWNFGDSAAWNSSVPGLPENPVQASTTSTTATTILDKIFLLPQTDATTLKKIEGMLYIDMTTLSGAIDSVLSGVDIVLWKIPASGAATVLATNALTTFNPSGSTYWQRANLAVSIDYGAGYSFADDDRIGIGIKTKGYVSGGAGTAYHAIRKFSPEAVSSEAVDRRTTFGFYFE